MIYLDLSKLGVSINGLDLLELAITEKLRAHHYDPAMTPPDVVSFVMYPEPCGKDGLYLDCEPQPLPEGSIVVTVSGCEPLSAANIAANLVEQLEAAVRVEGDHA